MARPITEEDLGLRVMYDGTDSSLHPEAGGPVDIVAVHGMGAHPDDTWCKKVDGHDGPVYVNWLKDEQFLPATVPCARIMRYGYSSQWFGDDAIKTKASDISQAFLFDLDEFREKDQNRPLILIGHSFGGLVLLKMLVEAHLERKRWPGIYDSTVGLVFLGTPFRGTHDSLSQGEILRGAYELFSGTPVHGENLDILRAGGEPLTELVDQYLRIVRQSAMPRVACFYEQRASEIGRILGKDLGKAIQSVILVNETSGSLDLNEKLDKYALPRTHFDIQKFGSPDEQAFRQVRRAIRKMVDESPQLVSVRAESGCSCGRPPCVEEQLLLKEKQACVQSLCFPNIDVRQQDIASAHPETCNWFFKTAQFRKWLDRAYLPDHNGVLWIKGNPGTGKSTLMKHTLGQCRRVLEHYTIAAYFFNARGVDLEKTPCGMLRSLVYQLVDNDTYAYERFLPLFRKKQEMHRGAWEWRESELKAFLLSEIQSDQSNPLLLLVDALDECSEPHVRDVVRFLEQLSTTASGTRIFNICLSSRHYPHISMQRCQELVVEKREEHAQDIAKYVRDILPQRDDVIERELLAKASGVFMWVVLVVALLNIAYDEGKVEAMHRKLREVPAELEQLYQALVGRDKPDKNETILLLQWVLFAVRPLTPEELFHAMLAGTDADSLGAWDPSKITPANVRRRITHSSRGLVEVRKGKAETVQFIHESVNDFLLRNRRLQTLDTALLSNPIGTSHDCLRRCCMSYMDAPPRPKDKEQVRNIAHRYPFLKYASTYFLNHAEEAEAGHVVQTGFLRQLREKHDVLERVRLFHISFQRFAECDKQSDLLYMTAVHGHTSLAKILLEEGVDVNALGGHFGTALQAAASKGREEIVTLLLENGADVNAQGGNMGTALQVAAVFRQTEILKTLLERGADVNAHDGIYGTALQEAAFKGMEEIVTLLLEKGADVNAQGGLEGTALQAAASQGWGEEVVALLLLEKGADVNAQGGLDWTALQAAAYNGRKKTVTLLLDKGAEVNAQGGIYGTALQAAAFGGYEAIVTMMLEKGADVDAQAGPFGTALQAAAVKGNEAIVAMLLEKGADVNAQAGPFGTALQVAASRGHEAIVAMLREKGASGSAIQGAAFYEGGEDSEEWETESEEQGEEEEEEAGEEDEYAQKEDVEQDY